MNFKGFLCCDGEREMTTGKPLHMLDAASAVLFDEFPVTSSTGSKFRGGLTFAFFMGNPEIMGVV